MTMVNTGARRVLVDLGSEVSSLFPTFVVMKFRLFRIVLFRDVHLLS